ncbi:MAG TPA: GAF domain-containing protein, partial [Anaerolineae bacterium]
MTDHINNGTLERIQTQLEQLVTLVPELKENGQPAGLLWAGIQKELKNLTHDMTERKAQEAERERLLAETAALYNSSRAIAGALSERQTFDALFEQIRAQTPCEISVYRFDLVDGEAIWAKLSVNWQKINNSTYPEGTRFYLPENDQIRLLTTSEPIFIDDIATDERLTAAERDSFSPTAARSVGIMPLVARRQKLGAVMVYFTTPYTFTDHTKQLWLALIDQVCVG